MKKDIGFRFSENMFSGMEILAEHFGRTRTVILERLVREEVGRLGLGGSATLDLTGIPEGEQAKVRVKGTSAPIANPTPPKPVVGKGEVQPKPLTPEERQAKMDTFQRKVEASRRKK